MRVVGRDGFSIANCMRRVKAARRGLGPDFELMIDAHGLLEVATAIKLARELEPYDIASFEEPVTPDDHEGQAEVRRSTTIPIASESASSRGSTTGTCSSAVRAVSSCGTSPAPTTARSLPVAATAQPVVGFRTSSVIRKRACSGWNDDPSERCKNETPALESRRVRTQPLAVTGTADGPASERHPHGAQQRAQTKLAAVAPRRGRQCRDHLHALVQVRDRLGGGHMPERQAARLLPQRDRLLGLFRLGVMLRQQLGLGCRDVRQTLLDDPGDLAVQLLPATPQQRVAGGLLHKGVLEDVHGIGRRAPPKCQPRFDELG
jgi:Enolase C-terminal domain-like